VSINDGANCTIGQLRGAIEADESVLKDLSTTFNGFGIDVVWQSGPDEESDILYRHLWDGAPDNFPFVAYLLVQIMRWCVCESDAYAQREIFWKLDKEDDGTKVTVYCLREKEEASPWSSCDVPQRWHELCVVRCDAENRIMGVTVQKRKKPSQGGGEEELELDGKTGVLALVNKAWSYGSFRGLDVAHLKVENDKPEFQSHSGDTLSLSVQHDPMNRVTGISVSYNPVEYDEGYEE
jgi:hypothetical protein